MPGCTRIIYIPAKPADSCLIRALITSGFMLDLFKTLTVFMHELVSGQNVRNPPYVEGRDTKQHMNYTKYTCCQLISERHHPTQPTIPRQGNQRAVTPFTKHVRALTQTHPTHSCAPFCIRHAQIYGIRLRYLQTLPGMRIAISGTPLPPLLLFHLALKPPL